MSERPKLGDEDGLRSLSGGTGRWYIGTVGRKGELEWCLITLDKTASVDLCGSLKAQRSPEG